MRTFPDPEKPKSFYLKRVRRHREADELVRGMGWDGHRGCAVGCTLETYDHALYPALLGVPEKIAHLEDFLFEKLPEDYLTWPERFLAAIPEGADLSGVYPAWSARMLRRAAGRIVPGPQPWRETCRSAVLAVAVLHESDPLRHETIRWAAAAAAAESAARAAAAAAASAAWASEWAAEIGQQAADILELIASAPPA